jgi:hypothetical protein
MLSRLSRRLLPGLHRDITTRIRFPEKRSFLPVAAIALLLFTALCQTLSAQALLGTAQSFAVLGASTVTNTGPSVVTGNLGLSPGTSITGFPPGTVVGTTYIGGVAAPARADALNAYNVLAGTAPTRDLSGTDLGGLTLGPGVYFFSSSAGLTGTLTLDAQNNPNAVFIFRIGSSLVTGSNSSVIMINPAGGALCNVFFQVGSSATLGTGTQFLGTILADASVTVETGAGVEGRVVALTGAVTLDSNIVSVGSCNNGSLQVCKVAGAGVTAGTPFSFSISPVIPPQSTTVTVAAGPAPLGTCSAAIAVPAGSVQIGETVPVTVPATAVTSIFTFPSAALTASNLAAGTATVSVYAGATTIVTFTDAVPTGSLMICKVAQGGVLSGNVTFSVAGTLVMVPAGPAPVGSCSPALVEPAGLVSITETIPSGFLLTSIATLPSGALASPAPNLAAGTATVTVYAGGQTIVTFTDGIPTQEMCYAANLQAGESYINIGNTGYNGDSLTGPGSGAFGNICVNVYAFDATDEQLISCCSCLVTPNAMVSLGAKADLTSNTETGVRPTSISVKLIATLAGPGGTGTACTNSAESVTLATVVPGIVAWGTTLHAAPTAGTYATTGTACIPAGLSAQEVASVAYRCANIVGNGSTYGICPGCQGGAQ